MTVPRLKYLLSDTGFKILRLTTCLPKRRMWLLAPLAGLIRIYRSLLWSRARREKYSADMQSEALMGGRSVVVLARKQIGPEGKQPA